MTSSTTDALQAGGFTLAPRRRYNFWSELGHRWRRSPVGMIGTFMVLAVILVAMLAPFIAPYNPAEHHRQERFLPPAPFEGGSPRYILGSDQLGRDVLSRILFGARVSVLVGTFAAAIGGLLGATLGILAGYLGGVVDALISRFLETFIAIPFIVLCMALVGVLGPSLLTIIFVLGVTGWAGYARVVRGETLSVRERDYVTAARVVGATQRRIALRHILPNTFAYIIVLGTLDVASAILAESSLSYLGLGAQPPTVTWGLMIADGREYLATAWWLAIFPGLAISFTVLGVIFLGDWLRDALDPRLRGK